MSRKWKAYEPVNGKLTHTREVGAFRLEVVMLVPTVWQWRVLAPHASVIHGISIGTKSSCIAAKQEASEMLLGILHVALQQLKPSNKIAMLVGRRMGLAGLRNRL